MFPESKTWHPDDLHLGLRAEFERTITETDILAFAQNSGDCNPLHVDLPYALASNFQGRIVHGAFQVGLASCLLGMHLPGRSVLLGSVNARFPSALFFPCRVCVRGEITAWDRQLNAGQLRVLVLEGTTRMPTADIVLGFTLHESRGQVPFAPVPQSPARLSSDTQAVLVTGASGGVGAALVRELAAQYFVLGMVHRHPLDEDLRDLPNVAEVRADLADPSWENQILPILGERPLYGVVHAAWPGAPPGGLLQCPDDLLAQQLAFGTTHLVRLARLLFARVDEHGGRLIALGSMLGSAKPVLTLSAYGLGKSTLESTIRFLAPEMARKKVTVNAVCPSFLAVGMNKHVDERQQKVETARIPLGRLCTPADLAGAITYLLSPAASFVSGQALGLSGGQL